MTRMRTRFAVLIGVVIGLSVAGVTMLAVLASSSNAGGRARRSRTT